MVFKKEEGYNISELGNWNVASDYARLKIMKPLDFCDHYQNVARFGYDTFSEQLENFNIPLDTLKILGFKRLVNELIKLCGNARFAMKASGTLETLKEYEARLKKIRDAIPLLSKTITKQRQKEVQLIEEKYYRVLDLVLEIKSGINEPLNKNHLIFTNREQFDPQAYKERIIEDAITRG